MIGPTPVRQLNEQVQPALSATSFLPSQGIVMWETFLQNDGHTEERWLVRPKALSREEERHACVTSWRSQARRSSGLGSCVAAVQDVRS